MPDVLVACVGNIFLGDDGFGVEVARRLAGRLLPEGVRVVDFGIRSYDLAYALMEDWELAILVDAVPRGGQPGTVYLIEPELPSGDAIAPAVDAHTMSPMAVLQLVSALGGKIPPLRVIGCEPTPAEDDETGGMELSQPVRMAVDEAVRLIEELVANFTAACAADATKEAV